MEIKNTKFENGNKSKIPAGFKKYTHIFTTYSTKTSTMSLKNQPSHFPIQHHFFIIRFNFQLIFLLFIHNVFHIVIISKYNKEHRVHITCLLGIYGVNVKKENGRY